MLPEQSSSTQDVAYRISLYDCGLSAERRRTWSAYIWTEGIDRELIGSGVGSSAADAIAAALETSRL